MLLKINCKDDEDDCLMEAAKERLEQQAEVDHLFIFLCQTHMFNKVVMIV